MYYLVMPSLEARQGLIAHLKERGILSVFHYQPLHVAEMGLRYGGKPGDCPVSEAMGDRLLRLPFFYDLSMADQVRVVKAIEEYRCR